MVNKRSLVEHVIVGKDENIGVQNFEKAEGKAEILDKS